MKALLTRKIGMTSVLNEKGAMLAVTLLSAEPNVITQIKDQDNDGYMALQIGMGTSKKPSKPQTGHFKNAGISPKVVREVRVSELSEEMQVGEKLNADLFSAGDKVSVTSISKGKGWAGTIKRHNFHRGRKTHGGQSYRRPGSIGSMYPQRIFPGKKMAGQMGAEQVTTKNLKVAFVDTELNVIGVNGAVPGPKKSIVLIRGEK